jgi:hypothetical protein
MRGYTTYINHGKEGEPVGYTAESRSPSDPNDHQGIWLDDKIFTSNGLTLNEDHEIIKFSHVETWKYLVTRIDENQNDGNRWLIVIDINGIIYTFNERVLIEFTFEKNEYIE